MTPRRDNLAIHVEHPLPKRDKRPPLSAEQRWAAYFRTPLGSEAALAALLAVRGAVDADTGDDE